MNDRAVIGGNNPPAEIEQTKADLHFAGFQDAMSGAGDYADGELVTTRGQADECLKIKAELARAVGKGMDAKRLEETKPHRDETAKINGQWNEYETAIRRLMSNLSAALDPFLRKEAEEKAEVKRRAYAEAQRLEREAAAAVQSANAASYDDQSDVAEKRQAALDAKKAASAANRDTVKGLKTVHHHKIENMGALVNWIAKNDKDAIREFATEYARKHHREAAMDGVKTWTTKEAR